VVLPAATYLVAEPDFDAVRVPQTVAVPTGAFNLREQGGVWVLDATTPQPVGTSLTLDGLTREAKDLNGVTVRFVGSATEPFVVAQDTASEDVMAGSFQIAGGATVSKILCRRPLCVEVDLTNPDPANGAVVTVPDTSLSVRRVRDGSKAEVLRLAQVAPKEKAFLVVAPAAADPSATDSGTSQADKTQFAVEDKAWTPALSLVFPPDMSDTELVGEHQLVRLGDAKVPEALGVFGLLDVGGKKYLARPAVGNGDNIPRSGKVTSEFLTSDTPPRLDITVQGTTPIIITFAAGDPGWSPGTPVVVTEVVEVPQANGTWVVKRLTPTGHDYALYDPSTALTAATGGDVVVSAVVPLGEAFNDPVTGQARLARLKLDPNWKPTDRPLLQVQWTGTGQFVSENGKGVAWRTGGVVAPLYELPKQVKFLANSQLSPKLAFVLTATGTVATLQRTILFGDSAPPFQTQPRIIPPQTGDTATYFQLDIPNNRERVFVAVPNVTSDVVLHVVKSLPSGIAVFDRFPEQPPPRPPIPPVFLNPAVNPPPGRLDRPSLRTPVTLLVVAIVLAVAAALFAPTGVLVVAIGLTLVALASVVIRATRPTNDPQALGG
jgi:hypothetical protein